ncbi:MAG: hypothetical protein U5R31_00950 [Acidimicrobiia bacterium]|nr:hypothetical protein [Acidimicrobiia bacterium]
MHRRPQHLLVGGEDEVHFLRPGRGPQAPPSAGNVGPLPHGGRHGVPGRGPRSPALLRNVGPLPHGGRHGVPGRGPRSPALLRNVGPLPHGGRRRRAHGAGP